MFGVMTDYDYNATHKRDKVTVWSGPFCSTWDAVGYSLPKGDGYMLTTYGGAKVRVTCPLRSEETWEEADKAVNDALIAHFTERN